MKTWREGLFEGTTGAQMAKLARAGKYLSQDELYNVAVNPQSSALVKWLAASLYCERNERAFLRGRLDAIGDHVSLGPGDYLMCCSGGHLWIRNVEANRLSCPACAIASSLDAVDPSVGIRER